MNRQHALELGSAAGSAISFTGRAFTLSVLRIAGGDLEAIEAQLRDKLAEGGAFFRDAPVVLDLKDAEDTLVLAPLLQLLRSLALHPTALLDSAPAGLRAAAADTGLAVLGDRAPRPAPVAPPPPSGRDTVVTQPVRSGQQVYARGGDLIVLAPVSSGAEILADGSIHVHGTLRGRALAGVQGDENARVFCTGFAAELVSIAGVYRVFEEGDDGLSGRPAQIRLHEQQLVIEAG